MIENIPGEKPIEIILNEHKNKCLVLHGPPGIGKTSNAINFAWRMNDENKWICLWFNSETSGKFMVDLEALTVLMKDTNSENRTFEYRSQLIKKEFRANSETNFLLILDNLSESYWVESFRVNLPKNVSILATSRQRNVLEKIAHELKVEYFDEEQANSFFEKKFNKNRELSEGELELLNEYFKYDKILPYDLNLLISEINNNEFINLKGLLDG
jgi:AAA+ ATPase superfamily predicted ATPase